MELEREATLRNENHEKMSYTMELEREAALRNENHEKMSKKKVLNIC
jgi:hypothetical protein